MKKHSIAFKQSVAKDLRCIPNQDVKRILSRIDTLTTTPRDKGCIKLSNQECYRVRQSFYRINTTRWDSAEHLKTDEDIQLYLEACIEEAGDDPALIVHALSVTARTKNMSQLSRDTGLTREGLYKALSPDRNPTFATVTKAVNALGLQISVQTAH